MKEMLSNHLLRNLSDADFTRLMPVLEPVSLSPGERLSGVGEMPRFVYFPESAVICCHADMRDGKSAEIAMIGRDGVAGLTPLLGLRPASHTLNVGLRGSALRVKRELFERELEQSDGMLQSLLSYTGDYITQISQRAACNTLHRTEQRFAVWLLMLTDRIGGDAIEITQERIAQHLGVRRAGVSVLAGELQDHGILSYSRGNMRVADRRALEAIACECYSVLSAHGRNPIPV
jgi:CRP-like cAMP-binding protein